MLYKFRLQKKWVEKKMLTYEVLADGNVRELGRCVKVCVYRVAPTINTTTAKRLPPLGFRAITYLAVCVHSGMQKTRPTKC